MWALSIKQSPIHLTQPHLHSINPLTPTGWNSTQENSPRNSPDFAASPARLSWPACSRHTAACMHRFFHILGRPGEPAVWFMSESGAVGSWQARTYVGLPIISSGFETAAGVRGLILLSNNVENWDLTILTVMQLSYASRITSYSTSFHPFNDLSINSWLVCAKAIVARDTSSSLLSANPDPSPPSA